jgi:hypothetical protein
MNIAKTLVPIVLALAISACGTTTLRTQQDRIAIGTGVFLEMPAANELTESFNATQALVAEYEDRSFAFEAHIEARPGSISVVGLGALGGALFSITWDGSELLVTGSVEAQVVNAEYVLADVLLAHWDTRWLNRRLIGATVEVSGTSDERFVVRDGELIISIAYDSPDPWGGEARLTHIERKYVLHITTAEFDRP